MDPKVDQERISRRERGLRRRHAFAAAWALAALGGCAVYDSSLLNSSTELPVIDSADGSVASDTDAGDGPGSTGGSSDSSAGGNALGGESASSGGALGNGSGASGGSSATGSTGGVLGSMGGALGSMGGALGSAGSAAGSAGGARGSAGSGAGSTGGSVGLAGMSAIGGAGGVRAAGGSAGSAGGAPTLKELASGKTVTASTQQTGNEAAKGNDQSVTTRWCSLHGTFPQWWRVDLGGAHSLSHVDVQFEHPDRKYSYLIETSQDDAAYTQQAVVSGTGAVQTVDLPPSVSARYVRITVTNGVPAVVGSTTYPTWASFFEISVFGT